MNRPRRTPILAAPILVAPTFVASMLLAGCAGDRVTTRSGLSYIVTEPGRGDAAEWGDTVTIHESTSLEDGTLIFSTWDTGQPITFTLGAEQVVDGMEECVRGMRVGERRTATMPPAITRREPDPDVFGPDDTLVFDILLLDIVD